MEPLVSVIMPAYNAEKYIGEAIESILFQSYDNYELIIVEDASTDNTLNVIKTYKDKRIKLILNDCNMGISDTTNRGIQESKGKYIALLDDDDIAEKERLRFQVDYLEQHSEIDILGGRTTYIDFQGNVMDYSGIPRSNPKYIKAILLFNCMDFMNSTVMIRKEFLEKNHLRYRNGCYGMQDFKFYIESSKVGNISTIDKFLLRHRIHSNNESSRNEIFFRKERAEVYAEFQKDSLKMSGFCLEEKDLCLINKVLAETNGKCDSFYELSCLMRIFKELLRQAMIMKIDYYEELNHLCRVHMANQIIKLKGFFENI